MEPLCILGLFLLCERVTSCFLNVVSCIALRDRAQYAYGNCVIVGTTRVSLNMLKVETRLLYNRL